MNHDPIFEREAIVNDYLGKVYQMLGLCRDGIASTDSAVDIDLHKGGHAELYQTIHHLASEAIDMIETAGKS